MKKIEAIETLRKYLKPGDSIKCDVLHVSRSGMSRSIRLEIPAKDDTGRLFIHDISYLVARAIDARFDDKRGGVIMGGCGMNMSFAAVYNLGRVLFPDGFGLVGSKGEKKRRATSRKSAASMVRNGWVFRGRNCDASGWDNDGGYALDYRG